MRKNRNAFFETNNSFNSMGMINDNMPAFPGGMNPGFNTPLVTPNNNLAEKVSKLERNYAKLEQRVANLEANTTKTTDDFESTTNNMYII